MREGSGCDAFRACAAGLTCESGICTGPDSIRVVINGGGTVKSQPAGLDCPGTCRAPFTVGSQVTLEATPAAGFTFDRWSECRTTTVNPLTFTFQSDVTCRAHFAPVTDFVVTVVGRGRVTSTPAGIDCPGTCSTSARIGASYRLVAVADSDSFFLGWGGDCSGTSSTASVVVDENATCTATFQARPTHLVSVAVTGSGAVTGTGIDCPGDCSQEVPEHTELVLTATPAAGYRFARWKGACFGTYVRETIYVYEPKNCVAVFVPSFEVSRDWMRASPDDAANGVLWADEATLFSWGAAKIRKWDATSTSYLGVHLDENVGGSSGVTMQDFAHSAPANRTATAWSCVSGSCSGTHQVVLRNAQTNNIVSLLQLHTKQVNAVAFNADGTRLASGGEDLAIKLWNSADGAILRNWTGHEGPIRALAFSADGTRLASVGTDGLLKIWAVANGQLVASTSGVATPATSRLAWKSDGTRVAVAGPSSILIVDATAGTVAQTINVTGCTVQAWQAGTDVVVAACGSSVKLFDSTQGTLAHSLDGHTGPVTSAAFDGEALLLATSSNTDKTVRVWDPATGVALRTVSGHARGAVERGISGITWAGPENIASSGYDGTIQVVSASTGQWVRNAVTLSPIRDVDSVSASPDGSRLIGGTSLSGVPVWNASTGAQERLLGTTRGYRVAWAPTGGRIVFGIGRGELRIHDDTSGAQLSSLTGNAGTPSITGNPAWWSPDGTKLVTTGTSSAFRLWDVDAGVSVRDFSCGSENFAGSAQISPDGTLLAGTCSTTVRVWSLADGASRFTSQHYAGDDAHLVAWRPDGKGLAIAWESSLQVVDGESGEDMTNIFGSAARVTGLLWSTEGRLYASDVDGRLTSWSFTPSP